MSRTRSPQVPFVWSTLAVAAVSLASFTLFAQQTTPQSPGAQTVAPTPPAPPQGDPAAPVGRGFGGAGRGRGTEGADFTPKSPYVPRTPEEEAKGFILPNGYRMELVLADPDIISPSIVEFDGNGRMYVGEMISYMMDAEASREHDPISRIS